ncbi:MAG: hypothetical protein IPK07_10150 [Deltaproteobacteria bacterium]|nr:hypothetical protein [Deltaproteobacteria bacterium]
MAVSTLAGCQASRPEAPRIVRDVSRVAGDRFTSPELPPNRTTYDGRVTVQVQGGASEIRLSLFVPEKLTAPFLDGPPGAEIFASTTPWRVPFQPDDNILTGHHAICDPTEEFPRPGERPNPYACGPGLARDCYDVVVVNSTVQASGAHLWGTPLHVEVEHPKTADARIADVTLGTPVRGAFIPNTPEWTETAVTQDGRLLTGRVNRFPREGTNPETGETLVQLYDMLYSVLPDASAPCDVRGWSAFHPISHAPFDPHMVGRYGLAAYPLRDAEGHPIPDGYEVGGTYPWVDREGTNLFLGGIPDRLTDTPAEAYPRRCVFDGCEELGESSGWTRGYMVAGLWTHGKFVLLDSLINPHDWALPVDPAGHRYVTLYESAGVGPSEVRVGAGRIAGDRVLPAGFTGNANVLDSVQNVLNAAPNLVPGTPRDVVWLMSTGVATDEVAFDDYLNPDAFVVSNMQASVTTTFQFVTPPQYYALVRYWNGLEHALFGSFFAADVHVQNAATTLPERWVVPAYGEVPAYTGRIEPVAMGGVHGKGFWLDGSNRIRYPVAAQPRDVRGADWYVGLFLELRGLGERTARVLTFPDGSAVEVRGGSALVLGKDGSEIAAIALPRAIEGGFTHLGFNVRAGLTRVEVFHDGFPLAVVEAGTTLFELVPGDLVVGAALGAAPGSGVRGWVDDFKVFAQPVDLEVACNHAAGTLVRVEGNAEWAALAALYPAEMHERVHAAAGGGSSGPAPLHACVHDYQRDFRARHHVPAGTVSVREAIHFPEGPLRYGAPRPDSSRNAFCLSCHHPDGKGGLTVAALEPRTGVNAEDDRRRQPLQPLRRVFGNVPAGWISPGAGPGGPASHTVAPDAGLVVDQWTLPPAH